MDAACVVWRTAGWRGSGYSSWSVWSDYNQFNFRMTVSFFRVLLRLLHIHSEFHHQHHHHAPPWANVMTMASALTHRVRQVPCSRCCHRVDLRSGNMTYPREHKLSSAEWQHDVLGAFRKVHRFLIASPSSAFLLLVVGFPHSSSTLPPIGQI